MPKSLTYSVSNTKNLDTQRPKILVEIYLNLGTLRYVISNSNIEFGGETYIAKHIELGSFKQKIEGQISTLSISLDNIMGDVFAYVNAESWINKRIVIKRIWSIQDNFYKMLKEDDDAVLNENADFILLDGSELDADDYNLLFDGIIESVDDIDKYLVNITANEGTKLETKAFLNKLRPLCNHTFGDDYCNRDGLSDITVISVLDGIVESGSNDYFIDTTMSPELGTLYKTIMSTNNEDYAPFSLAVDENLVYSASYAEGLSTYKISDTVPFLDQADNDYQGGTARDVAIRNISGTTEIFVANDTYGLDTYTVDDDGNLTHVDHNDVIVLFLGDFYTCRTFETISYDNKYIYVSGSSKEENYHPWIGSWTEFSGITGIFETDGAGNLTVKGFFGDASLFGGEPIQAPTLRNDYSATNDTPCYTEVMNTNGKAGGGTTVLIKVGKAPSTKGIINTFLIDETTYAPTITFTGADSYHYETLLPNGKYEVPYAVAVTDTYIYVAKSNTVNTVDRFSINGSGELTLENSYTANGLNSSGFLTIYISGSTLYVGADDAVHLFDIDAPTGDLTFNYSIGLGKYPTGIVFDANKNIHCACQTEGIHTCSVIENIQDDFWKYGNVDLWVKGSQTTYTTQCESFDADTSKVTFTIPFPFEIDDTYSYNLYKGCPKTWDACGGFYEYGPSANNRKNFLGFIHLSEEES